MRKNKKIVIKLTSLMLAVFMLFSVFSICFTAGAANVTKKQRTYDIAVVFDNSNSMFMKGEKAWCQAKYAIEIFASMLNYENGDTLTIFPMWEVSTDNTYPATGSGIVNPVVVDSKNDIDLISNMFTIKGGATPFAPASEAYDYLKNSAKTDKWLIVLTDGAFNNDERNDDKSVNVQQELEAMASDEIKVQYLAMLTAESDAVDIKEKANLYSKVSDTSNLQTDLSEICNRIFKRSVLPGKYINGNTIKLDVSMNNVIVFAQGANENVKITSLKNANGESVGVTFDSGVRKYSEISGNKQDIWEIEAVADKTLFGQVVTFAACPAGEYTIDCSGTTSIQVFYEPNVDILYTLKHKETGEEVYNSSESTGEVLEIVAGKYRIDCEIVDNVTNNPVTNSDLLGDVELKAEIVNSQGEKQEVKNGKDVKLEADEKTTINISGKYLDDYTISTEETNKGIQIRVCTPQVEDLQMNIEGAQVWYTIPKNEEWQPIKVSFTLDGVPLTAEQMKQLEFAVTPSKESLQLKTEMLDDVASCVIYISKDANGNFVEPEEGVYTLDFSAQLPANEYGLRPTDSENKYFEMRPHGPYFRIMVVSLCILGLIALFCMYKSKKALPKKLKKDVITFTMNGRNVGSGTFKYDRKGKKIDVSSDSVPNKPEAECQVTLKLKAVDRRWVSSKNRHIGVVGISSTASGVVKIVADGNTFVKRNGEFVLNSAPDEPIDFDMTREPEINIEARSSKLSCTTIQS